MGNIYVVRHGQSTWNRDRRWAGHANPPLTDLGRLQAKEAAVSLRKYEFTAVTSSSLDRARESAVILAQEMDIDLLEPVTDLNERHYGEISGLTSLEIEEKYPEFMREWRAGNPIEIPGGENWREFVSRVSRGIQALFKLPGCTLVVGHMGVLRAIQSSTGQTRRRYENLDGLWVDVP